MTAYEYKLEYPVHTFDNKPLLPEGSTLTDELLNDIRKSGKKIRSKTYKLMDFGSVKNDILDFLTQPPYNAIFLNNALTARLLPITLILVRKNRQKIPAVLK
jgi:hypothetical protein